MNPFNSPTVLAKGRPKFTREVVSGFFDSKTRRFSASYRQFVSGMSRSSIPCLAKPFTVEGNTFQITDVSDTPPKGSQFAEISRMGNFYPWSIPQKFTYFSFQLQKITNPSLVLNLMPADETGIPYGGLDNQGNILSKEESDKRTKNLMKMLEESKRTGKQPQYYDPAILPPMSIEALQIDPSNILERNQTIYFRTNVERTKIKALSIAKSYRTNYVFNNIALDPTEYK
jgi:hypothetical protein